MPPHYPEKKFQKPLDKLPGMLYNGDEEKERGPPP